MVDSVLDLIKDGLGINAEDLSFDTQLIMHINAALNTLTQLGVGDPLGYGIKDKNNTWDEVLGIRKDLEMIKTYVYRRVRLVFDPPTNSFLVRTLEEQIKEDEWRIEFQHDENAEE